MHWLSRKIFFNFSTKPFDKRPDWSTLKSPAVFAMPYIP